MGLAISLLSRKSLTYELYAAVMDGSSIRDLAIEYRMPEHRVQEQVEAVRLALRHQVRLSINTESRAFRTTTLRSFAA
jgi:hypothetical protein